MVAKGSRWRLALYLFLVTSTFGFLQPFVPLYMQASGLSKGEIGLATGFGTGLALLVQPFLGRWSDHADHRRPFICGSGLMAAFAYLSFPYAHGLPTFMALTAIGSNGIMYLQAAGAVLVGRLVTAERGGAGYASLRVWGSVGYIVVSLLSGLLLSLGRTKGVTRESLDPLFQTGPWLFAIIAAFAWFLPDRRNETVPTATGKSPLPKHLKVFLLSYFLYNIALYGSSPFLSLYMKQLGAIPILITGMFAAGVVVEVLVMRRSGALSDEYGRRPLLALSFLLLPVRLLLYVPATGPMWVAAVQMLHGINFGIVGAVAIAFANDLATEHTHGRAQARLAAVSGLASAVGPVILGFASDQVGLRGMFVVSATIAAAAAAIMVFGVEDSHPQSRPLAERHRWLAWLDAPPKR